MLAALLARLLGPRLAGRITPWLVLLSLSLASYWLAGIFGASVKLQNWLFWRYAGVWVCALVFVAACLSIGNWIVTRLAESEERGVEHFTLSFATGVFAFFFLSAAVGYAHGYGRVAFVLIPLALFAVGARLLWQDVRLLRDKLRAEPHFLSLRPLEVVGFAIGAVALVVIYLGVLVPENAAYDSRWYHLGLAENYWAGGRITRSVEGSVTATVPHLASILYTWAYCIPWGGLFERIELCAHLEFVIFALTLPGLVAMVRHLVPDAKARAAWVTVFVFPSIFLYDSSLHIAADHVAALWSIPVYLTFARAFRSLSFKACLLFAVQVSGLLLAKYTAALAVAGPVLVLTVRALYLTFGQLRRAPRHATAFRNLCGTLAAGLVFTSPHWLKNLIWHGDPLYPMLHAQLGGRPWNGNGTYLFKVYQSGAWAAEGTTSEKLHGALKALLDYSYALYNWPDFHGTYPIFGSLFTAGLLALPFLRGTRRIWGVVLMAHLGIALWYWMFHAERYLQALLPWMAATVAALAILGWRSGWPARLGVVMLGGLQIVWGLDMVFWPLHRMSGKSPVGLANDFFSKGYGADGAARTLPFEEYAALGRTIPRDSKVLVHREHPHTGLGTMTVTDAARIQYGINYAELGSPRAVDRLLKEYGVTHVMWDPGAVYGDESVGGDLVFHAYMSGLTKSTSYGSRALAHLPAKPPRELGRDALVYLCDGAYAPGVYAITALGTSPYALPGERKKYPSPSLAFAELAAPWPANIGYAIVNSACQGAPKVRGFAQTAMSSSIHYYVRNPE